MGSHLTTPGSKSDLVIKVRTGDRKNAGTNANVQIRLHTDSSQASEPIVLNNVWRNDFKRGHDDSFHVSKKDVEHLDKDAKLSSIEIWRDDFGFNSNWYVDTITIESQSDPDASYVFPVFRWVSDSQHLRVSHLDTSLPQFDQFPEQRKRELEVRRKEYEYTQNIEGGHVQVKNLPEDECFSFSYLWDITSLKLSLIAKTSVKKLFSSDEFRSLDSIIDIYDDVLDKPRDPDGWKNDIFFGYQRIASHNTALIQLCTEIPEKFPVTDDTLGRQLNGLSLADAIAQRRMFVCDYQLMEGLPTKQGYELCHPIGLFFVNDDGDLVPVAIQLYQRHGPENPIFTPEDPPLLWALVKMWYNNADAAYHQSITHLGNTHLMMEGVTVATHRTISHSHPIFKLLAPHFLYIIAINTRALLKLIPEGAWIDNNMNAGSAGTKELARRGANKWALNVDGTLPEEMKSRGLDDPEVLPTYHYREDGLELYQAINKYVTSYVQHYYKTPDLLAQDEEVQNWVRELAGERAVNGLGLKGVPGNGQLTTNEQLVQIVTCVIYTCSVTHAAVNFPQYNQYCYPPNYPSLMRGSPPTSKDQTVTEANILRALPPRSNTLDVMVVTKILSTKGTQSLGDFEVEYIYDPEVKPILEEFRKDLAEIGTKVKARNKTRKYVYDYLDPEFIPNSISI